MTWPSGWGGGGGGGGLGFCLPLPLSRESIFYFYSILTLPERPQLYSVIFLILISPFPVPATVNCREYWMFYRGPDILAVVWFTVVPPHPSYPPSLVSKPDWRHKGRLSNRRAETYDGEKAWSSINHSILSGSLYSFLADKCLGWWKLTSESLVGQIESAIIQKGSREQHLLVHLR